MPIEVDYSREEKMILLKCHGKITIDDVETATIEGSRLIKSHESCKALVEIGQLEPAVNLVDIYGLPKLYESLGIPATMMIAVVASGLKEDYGDFQFYETVCINRGFQVKAFDNTRRAREWLVPSI